MPGKKTPSGNLLSDEELRCRIFANACVLFPSSTAQANGGEYEIVYGTAPRSSAEKKSPGFGIAPLTDNPPWQYAMLVRRTPSGSFHPLIRGQAWSTSASWSMALQGLLDATATAIHKKFMSAQTPPLGANDELPPYAPPQRA